MDGWNITFLLGRQIFRGENVSFREGIFVDFLGKSTEKRFLFSKQLKYSPEFTNMTGWKINSKEIHFHSWFVCPASHVSFPGGFQSKLSVSNMFHFHPDP